MRRFLQIATVLACSAVASWAGPSIVLSGNTSFTVNYNAFDEGDNTPFPLVNSSVLYTVSNWTTGIDSGNSVPFATGTKYTSFNMKMEISNTSTVQSYVTSLGWVTSPNIDGFDSSVKGADGIIAGIWDEFNDSNPDNVFSPSAEFCLSSVDDVCNSPTSNGVQNGKKSTVTATMFFTGHGTVNFQNFFVRYAGMDYEIVRKDCEYEYNDAMGKGDVQTVVPEPSSFAALAAGVGAVAYAVRRRKQQA